MIFIPLNFRVIIGISITLMIVMIIYIQMNSKTKNDYEKITGQVTYLDKQLGQLPLRDMGKYRYLMVEGYEHPFEIFVGSESGDFKPKFEQIDKLKIGDRITVFYYQTENTKNERINRFIQFIDKGSETYFERGNSSKIVGIVVISLCVLLTVGGFVLWKTEKIRF
jgi:hypothetical protein